MMETRSHPPTLVLMAAVATLGVATTSRSHAQSVTTVTFGSDNHLQISANSDFNISVYDGKAGYAGTGTTYGSVTGIFGDGTAEAYRFWRNGGTDGDGVESYASDGSGVLSDITHTDNPRSYHLARGDVWTAGDPDSAPADFGGSTLTISGAYDVAGTIDISGFTSGTVYVLCGGYENPFQVDMTMSGTGQSDVNAGTGSIDPNPDRNMYVLAFAFDNPGVRYETLTYAYTGSVSNRARFMGVVVDAKLAVGLVRWSGLATSHVTTSTASASGAVNTALTGCELVWDTTDQGDTATNDWTFSADLGELAAGGVGGALTGLAADTSYTWRLYGTDGAGEGWSLPQTFATALSAAQAPAFISTDVVTGTLSASLGWADNASTETAYQLLRSPDGSTFSVIATLDANTVSHVDTVPAPGEYYYRLSAINTDNGSSTAPALCATGVISFPDLPLYGIALPVGEGEIFDLSAHGGADWAYWTSSLSSGDPGIPANEKSGATLIGAMSPYDGGTLRGSTSSTQPTVDLIFSDGTSPAAGSAGTVSGLFNTVLATTNVGAQFSVTLPTTDTWQVLVWTSGFGGESQLTATFGGATHTSPGEDLSGGGKPTWLHAITATPDSAGQALEIRNVLTANGSSAHAIITAAAVAVKPADSDGDGLTDVQEQILGLNPFISDEAFVAAVGSHPHFFGLNDPRGILGLGQGGVVLPDSGGGTVDLDLELQSGSDLLSWLYSTPVRRSIPLPAGAGFLRVTFEQP